MMKNTQNQNSKYLSCRNGQLGLCVCVCSFIKMRLMILAVSLARHISRAAVCNMRTKCDTAACSVRKRVQTSGTYQRSKFFGQLWFQDSKY